MEFDINQYKLKHMVSMNPDFISDISLDINIEGQEYEFKSDQVNGTFIEFVHYFKYESVKLSSGPVEKKLKEYTHGKSFNDFSEHELYEIRFSKFKVKIDDNDYILEIRGVGPVALKVSLYMKFSDVDTKNNPLEKELKILIRGIYTELIENNDDYKEKLKILKEESDKKEKEKAKIREEIKREEEEKRRKMEELEKRLNSNKPNNNKPFKMY